MTRTSTPAIPVFALKVQVDYSNCHKFTLPVGYPIFIKFTCNACRHPHSGKGIGVPIKRGNVHTASFNCSNCNLLGEVEISGPSELYNPSLFGIEEAIPQTLLKVSSRTSEPTEFLATHVKIFNEEQESLVVTHGTNANFGEIEAWATITSHTFITERSKKSSSSSSKKSGTGKGKK